jgi:Spy/CpxP family protein refolding chaperone
MTTTTKKAISAMKRIYTFAMAAALAAAPAVLPAAAHAQEQGTPARERGPGAFGGLLRHRAELNLTDDQVRRLESIRQRLEEQNRPLLERLRAAGVRRGPGARPGRGPSEQRRAELRRRVEGMSEVQRDSLRRQMRERSRAVGEGQRDSLRRQMRVRMRNLSEAQRDSLRSQLRERRGPRGERRGPGAGPGRLPEELRPVMEQLRANARAAREQAQAVLTDAQKEKLRSLASERRGREGRAGRRPR